MLPPDGYAAAGSAGMPMLMSPLLLFFFRLLRYALLPAAAMPFCRATLRCASFRRRRRYYFRDLIATDDAASENYHIHSTYVAAAATMPRCAPCAYCRRCFSLRYAMLLPLFLRHART